MSEKNENQITRATGLLVIEVINSNPNGDPDRENDPRQRPDDRGEISPVSFKRKVRDLIENTDGPVWKEISQSLKLNESSQQSGYSYEILESRERARDDVNKLSEPQFIKRYWDGRVFGNTWLEKGGSLPVKTGVAQFGLGISVCPILIGRRTTTNPAVQKGKEVGMAPLAYRTVEHGVYCMPFFINPTAATKSGCTKLDIDLLLRMIPLAYPHTASYIRPFVGIRHAWYIEHKNSLGSCSDFTLIDALTPTKRRDPNMPSTCWNDYEHPTYDSAAFQEVKDKVGECRDLMDSL